MGRRLSPCFLGGRSPSSWTNARASFSAAHDEIAVVGATGPTGIHVVTKLRKTVAGVRVIARSTDRLALLFPIISCDSSHSFPPCAQVTFRLVNGQKAMIDLLIGYAVAIAIVFIASRPLSINRPRW